MNDFEYYAPTEYLFGRGVESRTGEMVVRYGGHQVMVVYGGGSAVRSGLLARVEAALESAGIGFVELGGVQPNPLDDKVYEGIARCRETGVDMVLGVGGGSVIDTAKAIAAGVLYDGDFWDFWEGTKVLEEALPVGVVLTIPAAGSEGSGNSVITKASEDKKISLRTPRALRPKFALMNPELTFTLPAYQTAAGATDMMAHIMERYFTNTADTVVTDALSEGLLRAIIELTPQVLASPEDYQARANLMWCGTLAHNGICGTGNEEDWASHRIEHEISAEYGVTHGAGLAVVFPAWMTWMVDHNVGKVARFARNVFGVPPTGNDREEALAGIAAFKAFLRQISMPTTFQELGVNHPDIDLLADKLHEHLGATVGNYVRLTRADTRAIYALML